MIPEDELTSRKRVVASLHEKTAFLRRGAKTLLANRRFRQTHPDFPVPPLYLLWEAQSYTSYALYRESGATTAQMYWQIFRTQVMTRGHGPYRVLEWGCGPARIVRHMPKLAAEDGVDAEFYATDYNSRSVAWARANVSGVQFELNALAPPLPFPREHFDFV